MVGETVLYAQLRKMFDSLLDLTRLFSCSSGNMALHFDSAGTCLIVKQYIERSRNILRSDLGEKIQLLFSHDTEATDSPTGKSENAAPAAKLETALSGDATGPATDANTITV